MASYRSRCSFAQRGSSMPVQGRRMPSRSLGSRGRFLRLLGLVGGDVRYAVEGVEMRCHRLASRFGGDQPGARTLSDVTLVESARGGCRRGVSGGGSGVFVSRRLWDICVALRSGTWETPELSGAKRRAFRAAGALRDTV